MRTHHALQPRTPEQASYSIGRRDGKQFLKLYRSYLHGTLAGTREPRAYLDDYRARCVTVGRPVRVVRGEDVRTGFAEAVDDDFALVVRWPDGTRETVTGGDVSVRGLFGYLD